MEAIDIFNNLQEKQQELLKKENELIKLGKRKAETERIYRVALAKKILIYRAEKYPASLVQDLVRGDSEVGELRLERDLSENIYFVTLESMRNLRLTIETLRSLLTWQRVELQNS